MKTLQDLLKELHACSDAREWAETMSIEEVVEKCDRGDWLLWLAWKLKINERKITLAKGLCANTVRYLMKDERSIAAVNTAIAYGKGEASKKELNAAANAAYYVTNADSSDSACAAVFAADFNSYYSVATASADAACAAADNRMSAYYDNMEQTADICREEIGKLIIQKVNKLLKQGI